MRRIPLILAVLALVAGLGLIAVVIFNRGPVTTDNASFSPALTATASGSAAPPPPPSAAPASPSARPTSTPYAFPVVGKASYARTHHDYPASDIISACGNAVVSPVNGVVLEVTLVDTWDPKVNAGATRGGLSWSILGDDGVRYYGSHLSSIERNVRAGVRVKAGQKLGKVGRTGDTTACHLHFGLSPVCQKTGDWWIRRGVIWPWSYLDAWRAGTRKSPAAAVAAWKTKNGCPKKPLVDP